MLINYERSDNKIRSFCMNSLTTGVYICCLELFLCISEGLCEVIGYASEYPQLLFKGKDERVGRGYGMTFCPYCGKKLNPEED